MQEWRALSPPIEPFLPTATLRPVLAQCPHTHMHALHEHKFSQTCRIIAHPHTNGSRASPWPDTRQIPTTAKATLPVQGSRFFFATHAMTVPIITSADLLTLAQPAHTHPAAVRHTRRVVPMPRRGLAEAPAPHRTTPQLAVAFTVALQNSRRLGRALPRTQWWPIAGRASSHPHPRPPVGLE